MPGETTEIEYRVWYKDADTLTGSWIRFDPVGAVLTSIQTKEGRGVGANVTLAGSCRIRWEVDTVSEFQWFDRLREGLPIMVELVHPSPSAWEFHYFRGWVAQPAVESLEQMSVTVTATDGVGKANGVDYNDFVRDKVDAEFDVFAHFPMNEEEGTQIWPDIVNIPGWAGTPGGWYRDVGQHQAEPLRRVLGSATAMSHRSDDTPNQEAIILPSTTGIGSTGEHTIGGRFKLTGTTTTDDLIVGVTAVPSNGIRTVGLRVNNRVVSIIYRTLSGESVLGSFTATVGRVYTFAVSYAVDAPNFSVRGRIRQEGASSDQFAATTGWVTVPDATGFAVQVIAGPVEAVLQDFWILADGLFNAEMDDFMDALTVGAGSQVSELVETVAARIGVGAQSYTPKGETISESLGDLASVGRFLRELETLEQGAVWYDSNAGVFRFKTLAELQSETVDVQFDETTGDHKSYTAGSRVWGPVRNKVLVSSPSGEYETADADSVAEFGERSTTVNVPPVDRTSLTSTAGRILELYRQPRRFHPSLTIDVAASDDWDVLDSCQLFTRLRVSWPDGAAKVVHVVGREFRASMGVDSATLTLIVADLTEVALVAPTVTAVPAVSGTVDPGGTLTGTEGTWTDSERQTQQWQYSDDQGATVRNVPGNEGMKSTYRLGTQDTGRLFRMRVGAWNSAAPTVFAYSSWTTATGESTDDGFGEGAFGTDTFGE